ncbi:hypothetical protein AKJ16_DCAP17243 [Drosera capensis]
MIRERRSLRHLVTRFHRIIKQLRYNPDPLPSNNIIAPPDLDTIQIHFHQTTSPSPQPSHHHPERLQDPSSRFLTTRPRRRFCSLRRRRCIPDPKSNTVGTGSFNWVPLNLGPSRTIASPVDQSTGDHCHRFHYSANLAGIIRPSSIAVAAAFFWRSGQQRRPPSSADGSAANNRHPTR